MPAVDATVVRAANAAPPVAGLLAVARGSASSIAHPPPGERSFAAVFPLVLGALAVDFFFVDGSGGDRIRLSFATLTPDELGEAAKRLARALTSAG